MGGGRGRGREMEREREGKREREIEFNGCLLSIVKCVSVHNTKEDCQ